MQYIFRTTIKHKNIVLCRYISASRLEHGEEGAGEGPEVVRVAVREEIEGRHGEDGEEDAQYGQRVGHCDEMKIAVAERLRREYPALPERAGVGSIPANPDARNVPSIRRWRFEMKLSPFLVLNHI